MWSIYSGSFREGDLSISYCITDKVRFTDLFLSSHWSEPNLVSNKTKETRKAFVSLGKDWSNEVPLANVQLADPGAFIVYLVISAKLLVQRTSAFHSVSIFTDGSQRMMLYHGLGTHSRLP